MDGENSDAITIIEDQVVNPCLSDNVRNEDPINEDIISPKSENATYEDDITTEKQKNTELESTALLCDELFHGDTVIDKPEDRCHVDIDAPKIKFAEHSLGEDLSPLMPANKIQEVAVSSLSEPALTEAALPDPGLKGSSSCDKTDLSSENRPTVGPWTAKHDDVNEEGERAHLEETLQQVQSSSEKIMEPSLQQTSCSPTIASVPLQRSPQKNMYRKSRIPIPIASPSAQCKFTVIEDAPPEICSFSVAGDGLIWQDGDISTVTELSQEEILTQESAQSKSSRKKWKLNGQPNLRHMPFLKKTRFGDTKFTGEWRKKWNYSEAEDQDSDSDYKLSGSDSESNSNSPSLAFDPSDTVLSEDKRRRTFGLNDDIQIPYKPPGDRDAYFFRADGRDGKGNKKDFKILDPYVIPSCCKNPSTDIQDDSRRASDFDGIAIDRIENLTDQLKMNARRPTTSDKTTKYSTLQQDYRHDSGCDESSEEQLDEETSSDSGSEMNSEWQRTVLDEILQKIAQCCKNDSKENQFDASLKEIADDFSTIRSSIPTSSVSEDKVYNREDNDATDKSKVEEFGTDYGDNTVIKDIIDKNVDFLNCPDSMENINNEFRNGFDAEFRDVLSMIGEKGDMPSTNGEICSDCEWDVEIRQDELRRISITAENGGHGSGQFSRSCAAADMGSPSDPHASDQEQYLWPICSSFICQAVEKYVGRYVRYLEKDLMSECDYDIAEINKTITKYLVEKLNSGNLYRTIRGAVLDEENLAFCYPDNLNDLSKSNGNCPDGTECLLHQNTPALTPSQEIELLDFIRRTCVEVFLKWKSSHEVKDSDYTEDYSTDFVNKLIIEGDISCSDSSDSSDLSEYDAYPTTAFEQPLTENSGQQEENVEVSTWSLEVDHSEMGTSTGKSETNLSDVSCSYIKDDSKEYEESGNRASGDEDPEQLSLEK